MDKHFSVFPPSLQQSPKKNLDTRWYECVHNCPQASGDFTGSLATSSWVALSGTCQAAETTCKCDPERLHKLLNKRALWEHSRPKAETKRWCDKTFLIKSNGESDCVARKTRTAKYGKYICILQIRGMRGYIGTIRNTSTPFTMLPASAGAVISANGSSRVMSSAGAGATSHFVKKTEHIKTEKPRYNMI